MIRFYIETFILENWSDSLLQTFAQRLVGWLLGGAIASQWSSKIACRQIANYLAIFFFVDFFLLFFFFGSMKSKKHFHVSFRMKTSMALAWRSVPQKCVYFLFAGCWRLYYYLLLITYCHLRACENASEWARAHVTLAHERTPSRWVYGKTHCDAMIVHTIGKCMQKSDTVNDANDCHSFVMLYHESCVCAQVCISKLHQTDTVFAREQDVSHGYTGYAICLSLAWRRKDARAYRRTASSLFTSRRTLLFSLFRSASVSRLEGIECGEYRASAKTSIFDRRERREGGTERRREGESHSWKWQQNKWCTRSWEYARANAANNELGQAMTIIK